MTSTNADPGRHSCRPPHPQIGQKMGGGTPPRLWSIFPWISRFRRKNTTFRLKISIKDFFFLKNSKFCRNSRVFFRLKLKFLKGWGGRNSISQKKDCFWKCLFFPQKQSFFDRNRWRPEVFWHNSTKTIEWLEEFHHSFVF